MTYAVSIICDHCGASTPPASSPTDARYLAKKGGWGSVPSLHLYHLCKACLAAAEAAQSAKPKKRTRDDMMREKYAAATERLKIVLLLRRSGKTLVECGKLLGVSGARAGQMIKRAEAFEASGWPSYDEAPEDLSVRELIAPSRRQPIDN